MPTTTLRPASDVLDFFVIGNLHPGPNLWQDIDEVGVDTSDFILPTINNFPVEYRGGLGVSVGDFSGKAISNVHGQWVTSQGFSNCYAFGGMNIGSTRNDVWSDAFLGAYPATHTYTMDWTTNPTTGTSWKPTDIESMASSNYFYMQMTTDDIGNPPGLMKFQLVVTWQYEAPRPLRVVRSQAIRAGSY